MNKMLSVEGKDVTEEKVKKLLEGIGHMGSKATACACCVGRVSVLFLYPVSILANGHLL